MTDEILELSALAPKRPKATLRTDANPDGTVYELAVPEDFGAADLARMAALFGEIRELQNAKKITPAKGRRLEQLVDTLARGLIHDAPREEVAALPASTKQSLIVGFFTRAGRASLPFLGELASPSESSSPGSSGSTAERLKAGSR